MNTKKVLVFGHSFVRRLSEWMKTQQISMDLECQFHIHGVGGRTIAKLINEDIHVVKTIQPDIVFLQIGENDINRQCNPHGLAQDLVNLVTLLKQLGVDIVIIGSLYPRPTPRDMPEWAFSSISNEVNKLIQSASLQTGSFLVWHHTVHRNRFARDGVHLNSNGHRDFFNSIRTALGKVLEGNL